MSGLCPNISNLKLSPEGQSSLNQIKKITESMKLANIILTGGSLYSILFNKKVAINVVNMYYTDWGLLATALKAFPAVERRQIDLIAATQMIRSQGGAEYEFWNAFYNHCRAR